MALSLLGTYAGLGIVQTLTAVRKVIAKMGSVYVREAIMASVATSVLTAQVFSC